MKKSLISFIFSILVFLTVFGFLELEKALINSSFGFRIFTPIEKLLLDLRFYYQEENFNNRDTVREYVNNSRFVSHETLIIGIDQESLVEIGEWPWYRHIYKDFLRKVQHFTPLSLHIDVIFNISEEIPTYMETKLKEKNPNLLNIVKENYSEMDGVFIEELNNYNNIYVDQLLLKSRFLRFETDFVKNLNLNEKILKKNSIPLLSQNSDIFNIPYVYTEPLIPGVMQNAIPAVVNAETDSDKILRKAVLLYPYQTQKNEKILISSIYFFLLMNYYHITKESVEVFPDRIVFRNALTANLEPESKSPKVEIWDFSRLKSILTENHIQKNKYNQNLFHYIVNIYQGRFQGDQIKMPDFPIHLLDNLDGTYTLIQGKEIFDAALALESQQIKVIVKKKKNIEIPLYGNQDNNPFTYYINFGSREFVQGKEGDINFKDFTLPKKSFKDIYNTPYLPDIPPFPKDKNFASITSSLVNQPKVRSWFTKLIDLKIKSMQKTVFTLYRDIGQNSMLNYAVQDNHYEGFFYLIHLYLKKYGWNFNAQTYQNFVINFFKQNRIELDHPLIIDFTFSDEVVYDLLIDSYSQGFQDFYGKTVFVGALTTGMARDVHKTTFGDMFGITTIVNAFNTVIKDNLLQHVPYNLEIISLFFVCLGMGLTYTFLPLILKYIFVFISTLLIIIISTYLFSSGFILTTSPFIASNITLFFVIILYSIFVEQRDKKFLQLSFSDYLSPELIEEMYQKKERPQLGGEEKTITAYFTDIQGFSSFSELLTASQLVELLNEYLGKMTDILMEEKGTLDKYEGDAIIAFFGAPYYSGDESLRACRTAIRMQKELVLLTEKWKQEKTPVSLNQKEASEEKWDPQNKWPFLVHNMKMRIGLNTGNVVVGNMGSEKRKNYTMMGDAVNLAARLESLSKQYGLFTLASENVMESVNKNNSGQVTKDFLFYRLIDKVTVVGKEEPILIYELFALIGDETENERSVKEYYEAGLNHYFQMEWQEAEACFKKSLAFENNTKTNPSQIMLDRCQTYSQDPPIKKEEKWDGVFRQTKK